MKVIARAIKSGKSIVREKRGISVTRFNASAGESACPWCGRMGKRHSTVARRVQDLGVSGPAVVEVTLSRHRCEICESYYSHPNPVVGNNHYFYTRRVRELAIEMVESRTGSLRDVSNEILLRHHVRIPVTTLHTWVQDKEYSSIG